LIQHQFGRNFVVVDWVEMKSLKPTIVLMIGLALTNIGCASLGSASANHPTLQPEQEQTSNAAQDNPAGSGGWAILYVILNFGGTFLASK
jgi:hypothetical protein